MSRNPTNTKLEVEDVREIKKLLASLGKCKCVCVCGQLTQKNIAKKFNISKSTISAIAKGISWKNI